MNRRGFGTVLVAGCSTVFAGCLSQPGLNPPEGAVVDGDGIAVVRLENPILRGAAYIGTTAVTPSSGLYTEVRTMAPDGAFLTPDTPGVMTDDGWVSNDLPPGTGSIGAPGFDAPAISLPMGGAPVGFNLTARYGRVRTEPVPPGTVPPPIGYDEDDIDEISIALDPRVLVVPVHVYAFVDTEGGAPYWSGGSGDLGTAGISQILDPGAVATLGAVTTDDGFESRVTTTSGVLRRSTFEPDSIWTQCDIQFHLESFEFISQQDNLEDTMRTTCLCPFSGPGLGPYLAAADDGLPVYIGGRIAPGGGLGCPFAFDILGLTCAAPAPCATSVPSVPTTFDSIIIDGRFFPQALPHELGHFLGLGHTDGDGTCAPDAVGASGNLMGSGSSTGTLTPDQCARARCIAGRRLVAWGRLSASEADALCAGF